MAFRCTIPATPTVLEDTGQHRITRWDFPPGGATGWHRHEWSYFVTMVTDGILRVHNGTDVVDVPLAAGQSYARPPGIEHDVMNGSDHPITFVEIEIKAPSGP
jgi:quercetin dioxygenase-like cupin family protein